MIFIMSFFSTSPVHVWRRLPYIKKDESSERLKGLYSSLTNEGLFLDQWKN